MAKLYRATPTAEAQAAPLRYLLTFCRHHGLKVTSGEHIDPEGNEVYPHGGHNSGSLHYRGRAVDVSVRELSEPAIGHIIQQALSLGINVYDERVCPAAGVCTGPHLHLSVSPPGTELV